MYGFYWATLYTWYIIAGTDKGLTINEGEERKEFTSADRK